jgi:hypothetical protein
MVDVVDREVEETLEAHALGPPSWWPLFSTYVANLRHTPTASGNTLQRAGPVRGTETRLDPAQSHL